MKSTLGIDNLRCPACYIRNVSDVKCLVKMALATSQLNRARQLLTSTFIKQSKWTHQTGRLSKPHVPTASSIHIHPAVFTTGCISLLLFRSRGPQIPQSWNLWRGCGGLSSSGSRCFTERRAQQAVRILHRRYAESGTAKRNAFLSNTHVRKKQSVIHVMYT